MATQEDTKQKALDTLAVRYGLRDAEASYVQHLVDGGTSEEDAVEAVKRERVGLAASADYDPTDARDRLGSSATKLDKDREKAEADAVAERTSAEAQAEQAAHEAADEAAEAEAERLRVAAQGSGRPSDSGQFANEPEAAAVAKARKARVAAVEAEVTP